MTPSAILSSPTECEAIWQRTCRLTDFDPMILERERVRNAQSAYGLTLVADFPLPDDLLRGIERLRRVCRQVLGEGVELYLDDHLHLTVYSLMRSRAEPLPEGELATVWSRCLSRLEEMASQLSPLVIPLWGLSVAWNGAVMTCGAVTDDLRWLQGQVSHLPGVAMPRHVPPHITIGQVIRPFGAAAAFRQAMAILRRHTADAVGTLRSPHLKVLYYRRRLLDQVIQSAVIPLGQKAESLPAVRQAQF
jgi:hypothetical protein